MLKTVHLDFSMTYNKASVLLIPHKTDMKIKMK